MAKLGLDENIRYTGLSNNYVFYNRLKTDNNGARIELYNYINKSMNSIKEPLTDLSKSSAEITRMAQLEDARERTILKEKMKIDIKEEWNDNHFRQIIEALNLFLSTKDIYERNLQVIKNNKGSKGVFSFFESYFAEELEKELRVVLEKFEIKIGDNITETMESLIFNSLSKNMNNIVRNSLISMYEADVEAHVDPKYKKAYSALIKNLNDFTDSSNIYVEQMSKLYGVDSILEGVQKEMKMMTPKEREKLFMKETTKEAKAFIFNPLSNQQKARNRGITLEYHIESILDTIVGKLGGKTAHTGDIGNMKSDSTVTFGFDFGDFTKKMEAAITENEDTVRTKNVARLKVISDYLKEMNDSFIVYISAKNYTINDNFENKYKGFGVGEQSVGNLKKFYNSFGNGNRMSVLMGAILQQAKGAIGAKESNKNLYERIIAQDVAYFLFDDYQEIGGESTGNAIHVMNLNGIYIPLSLILYALAKAMEVAQKNAKSIVNVEITAPDILYKRMKDQRGIENPWKKQSEKALKETQIKMTILANFRNILSRYT